MGGGRTSVLLICIVISFTRTLSGRWPCFGLCHFATSTQPIYMITALFCFKVLTTMTQMLSSWSPRPLYQIPTTWKIVSRPVPLTTRHLTSLRPRPYHPRSTSIHQEK
ncbi:uncharacterized protein F5891DRAFT_329657 [Suillus fuscotomentosus]|uniref:Secreted protein n=1 Tax=Suillus fuscotomentosus TaxID=1912939 RepID=A0AAD4DQH4_9AGAM|nr:uncharacterized protein F5891DRAFT_329657 [Suillus fuscotomentosus]KAG1886322.1 hypothetical protein F5891DRAFT_329657 [Suillus fuscotomentosus]